jgi:hypothetical protein
LVGGLNQKASLSFLTRLSAWCWSGTDRAASGDNIGGMTLFVPLLVFAIVQYLRTRRLLGAS